MAVNCSSYPVFPGGRPPGEWKTVGKGAAETVFLPYACRKAREIYGRRGHAPRLHIPVAGLVRPGRFLPGCPRLPVPGARVPGRGPFPRRGIAPFWC